MDVSEISKVEGYETRVLKICIIPTGKEIYDELATIIEINDEAAGEFVIVTQPNEKDEIRIDAEEWPVIRDAVDYMIGQCRKGNEV